MRGLFIFRHSKNKTPDDLLIKRALGTELAGSVLRFFHHGCRGSAERVERCAEDHAFIRVLDRLAKLADAGNECCRALADVPDAPVVVSYQNYDGLASHVKGVIKGVRSCY